MATILVPLDGSALSEQALPYVRLLTPLLHAEICLLRVVPAPRPETAFAETLLSGWLHESEADKEQLNRAIAYLEAHAATLRVAGLTVTTMVQTGEPAAMIIAAIDELRPTLVILVGENPAGQGRWSPGSLIERVVHSVEVPVLVAHAGRHPNPSLRRVLVPLDGSPLARAALSIAVQLVTQATAELIVLTVMTMAVAPDDDELPADFPKLDEILGALRPKLLQELGPHAHELDQHGVTVTPRVVDGLAPQKIVEEAATRDVDLIVMATHGGNGLRRWAVGSVADRVLQHTSLPLLLVRG